MGKVLTISVAAYNVEDTLEDTLNSLVTDPDTMDLLEVLIVDDGSSDNTAGVAEKFVSGYPGTFRLISKANGGYGSTINASVSQAAGKYFKQLDGGDTYVNENLSGFVTFLSENDSDIVVSPYEEFYVKDDKTVLKASKALDDGHLIKMHEIAFKTEVWKKLGRDIPEHCFYTDTEYVFYPLVYAQSVAYFDKPVYRYYLQCEGQSVSIEGIRKHFADSGKMMWDILDAYGSIPEEVRCGQTGEIRKARVLGDLVKHAASFAYTSYLQAGKENLKTLREMDGRMKRDYPEGYELTSSVKRIGMMRKTGLRLYGLYMKMLGSAEG